MIYPARNLDEAAVLARAIVNTICEPLLVLDAEFRVLAASNALAQQLGASATETSGNNGLSVSLAHGTFAFHLPYAS